jgi:hypothetical protein
MLFIFSNICSAADPSTIGSKITNLDAFIEVLAQAAEAHDFTKDRVPGQGFIQLPESVLPHVSAGVGKQVADPTAYCLREHRGRVGAYLKREFAAPTESCAVVVYTRDAYVADPDVTEDEVQRLGDATHVIVAVLATAGPQSQLSPYRFTHNLAGGNKEAQVWTADEIREKAKAILDYDNTWSTVADER